MNKASQLLVLAALALAGLLFIQGYWFRQAFLIEQDQFGQGVNIALREVADQVLRDLGDSTSTIPPVDQLAANQFAIRIENDILYDNLELSVNDAFARAGISPVYLLTVWDCELNQVILGFARNRAETGKSMLCIERRRLPGCYNLQVQFPAQTAHVLGKLWIWLLTGLVFVLVLGYFSYSLYLMRKEKRIAEMRKDLINNLAHELQTPITNIGLASETLSQAVSEGFSKTKTQQYADIIRQENQRLQTQVDRVLEIALMAPARLKLHREQVDLNALVESVTGRYLPQIEARDGSLDLHATQSEAYVLADPFLIEQVLHNLLDNAIKYSPGKPEIHLSIQAVEEGWEVSVKDEGLGIRKHDLKHIFETFYRVSEGDKHNIKGFGLGLSYAKGIIEAHGGSIRVESAFRQGSRFSFVI